LVASTHGQSVGTISWHSEVYRPMRYKRIQQLEAELVNCEKLLDQEKKEIKRAKGKVAKDNKKRALKVMKKSVEALEDQKEVIKRGGQIPVE
jgi:hypothetical protein